MTFTEQEIGEAFKVELERQEFLVDDTIHPEKSYLTSFKVYLNKRVSTDSNKFKKFWKSQNLDLKKIPPGQPEIDLILIDNLDRMRAIEIKYIKKRERRINQSYYVGLGQTLAYLSFGFHQVAIWLCFDKHSLTDKEIFRYNDAFTKIRTPLKEIVDATYFRIINKEQKPLMQTPTRYKNGTRGWKNGIGKYEPKTGKFTIRWISFNPLLKTSTPTNIFEFKENDVNQAKAIREFLELQRPEVWDK